MSKTQNRNRPCAHEGCQKLAARRGYCLTHYVTDDYRKRPEVNKRIQELNRGSRSRFHRGKNWATRHGIPWDVTLSEFEELITKPCFYCGLEPKASTGRGMDRLTNDRGYSLDNVVPCCHRCNIVRGYRFTVEETKVMMRALREYQANSRAVT